LQTLPVALNVGFELPALIAHGSPFRIRRDLTLLDRCRGWGDDAFTEYQPCRVPYTMILDISHVFFAWLKLSDCTPEKAREYLKIHWPRSNAAGWLMGLLAGLLVYFREHHIRRRKLM
jgi:hypothetical protein